MKFFLCYVTLFCFSSAIGNAQIGRQSTNRHYKIAVEKIFVTETGKSASFNVSEEILSFSNFAIFFKDELGSKLTSSQLHIDKDSIVITRDTTLKDLGCRRHKKAKVFFTEIQDDIFFAEVLSFTNKKNSAYSNRPTFGESKVFMLKVENENVLIVDSKAINYN